MKRQLRADDKDEASLLKGVLHLNLRKSSKVLVLSDLHLGLSRRDARSNVEDVVKLLRYVSKHIRPSWIILLGDVLELWQAKATKVLESAYAFFRELFPIDVSIVYVAGNHDRILAGISLKGFEHQKPLYIVPRYVLIRINGKRVLALHGHQFDSLFTLTLGLWRLESFIYTLSESLISLPGLSEWVLSLISAGVASLMMVVYYTFPLSFWTRLGLLIGSILLVMPVIVLVWRYIQSELWYLVVMPLSLNMPFRRSRYRGLNEITSSRGFRKFLKSVERDFGRIDCLVFGHTHVPGLRRIGNIVVVNSGGWISERGRASGNAFVLIEDGSVKLFRWDEGPEKIGEERI